MIVMYTTLHFVLLTKNRKRLTHMARTELELQLAIRFPSPKDFFIVRFGDDIAVLAFATN